MRVEQRALVHTMVRNLADRVMLSTDSVGWRHYLTQWRSMAQAHVKLTRLKSYKRSFVGIAGPPMLLPVRTSPWPGHNLYLISLSVRVGHS